MLGVVVLAITAFMTSLVMRNRRRIPTIPDTPDELLAAFAQADQGPGELFGDPVGALGLALGGLEFTGVTGVEPDQRADGFGHLIGWI